VNDVAESLTGGRRTRDLLVASRALPLRHQATPANFGALC